MGAAVHACRDEPDSLKATDRRSSYGSSYEGPPDGGLCRCDGEHCDDPLSPSATTVKQLPLDIEGERPIGAGSGWENQPVAVGDAMPVSPRLQLRGSDSVLQPYKWQPLSSPRAEEMIPTMPVDPGVQKDNLLGGGTLLKRSLSRGSEIALQHLAQLSDRLARLENRARKVHEAVKGDGVPGPAPALVVHPQAGSGATGEAPLSPRRMSYKRALVDIQGIITALQLQLSGVDGVEEADLESGLEAVQASKKMHKQREEDLMQRLMALKDELVANTYAI